MKRMALLALFCLGACGDDVAGNDGEALGPNAGFVAPAEVTQAFVNDRGVWTPAGVADWSCLGQPARNVTTDSPVQLTGQVEDFQSGSPVSMVTVELFTGIDDGDVIATEVSDLDGRYTVTIPEGTDRFGFKLSSEGSLDTFLLNQSIAPGEADPMLNIRLVSQATANALPAFINRARTLGRGVLAGAIRDCQGREVGNAVATVSSVSGAVDHLEGADTYYFSAGSPSLPVRHSAALSTNEDGLFMIIELPPELPGAAQVAYMQVWGFIDGQDPATDELTLLAELPTPVLPDTVVTASIEPLAAN